MKSGIIGKRIKSITYFDINNDAPKFFYNGFDNFDLGINIEFDHQANLSIAWRDNDRIELHWNRFNPDDYFSGHTQTDATERWRAYQNLIVEEVEIDYVNEY